MSVPTDEDWEWVQSASLAELEDFLQRSPGAATQRDVYGRTLLHAAVGDLAGIDKVALLLGRSDVDVNALQPDGTTPLYRAALAGNLAAVRLLLDRGVDVNNHNDDNRWTVLMVAAAQPEPDIVAALLAAPEIDPNARDDLGATALHLVAERGHQDVAARLTAHPAIEVNAKDQLRRTPLVVAAFADRAGVVQQLLEHPATDVNLVDRDRQTALHWAALGDHLAIVELLLADPRTNAGITNRPDHSTAMEVAAALGHDAVAERLRERMRLDPGRDELSAGDVHEPHERTRLLLTEPFVPHPPRPPRRGGS